MSGENLHVQAGDHHTLSHTTTVYHGDRTRVAAVRSECIVHYATWTPTDTLGLLGLNLNNDLFKSTFQGVSWENFRVMPFINRSYRYTSIYMSSLALKPSFVFINVSNIHISFVFCLYKCNIPS